METNYWNWYITITGIACVTLYYLTVLGLSTEYVSNLIQPELNQEYYRILTNAKALITIILLPIVALIPDMTYIIITRVFFPTPTDYVMQLQKKNPDFEYTGFRHIENPDYKPQTEEMTSKE